MERQNILEFVLELKVKKMKSDEILNNLIKEFGKDFVIDMINKEIKRRENGNQEN